MIWATRRRRSGPHQNGGSLMTLSAVSVMPAHIQVLDPERFDRPHFLPPEMTESEVSWSCAACGHVERLELDDTHSPYRRYRVVMLRARLHHRNMPLLCEGI